MRFRILLADDSPTARRMGAEILSAEGYEVVTANDAELALEMIQSESPELVLADVSMPAGGGIAVCRAVKADFGTAAIPVILSVGRMEKFSQEDAHREGADGLLVKPFEASELLTMVEAQIERVTAPGFVAGAVPDAATRLLSYALPVPGTETEIVSASAAIPAHLDGDLVPDAIAEPPSSDQPTEGDYQSAWLAATDGDEPLFVSRVGASLGGGLEGSMESDSELEIVGSAGNLEVIVMAAREPRILMALEVEDVPWV